MRTAQPPRTALASGLAPFALLVVAAIGCSSTLRAPVSPAVGLIPAVVPVPSVSVEELAARTTPEQAAAALEGQRCEVRARPRERALCYLQSESEASIEPLFAIGRSLGALAASEPGAYWPDFIYAAENAGVLAARGGDARLHAGMRSANESDQLFAVHALRHMLATLRFGYARGKDADAPVRAERLEAVRAACASKLGVRNTEMVLAASDCLREIHDPRDGARLISAVASSSSVQVQLHLVGAAGDCRPIPAASLKELVPLLTTKLTPEWTHDELRLRARICELFLQEVPAGDLWPRKPAEAAVREIDKRSSQARAPCEELANRGK